MLHLNLMWIIRKDYSNSVLWLLSNQCSCNFPQNLFCCLFMLYLYGKVLLVWHLLFYILYIQFLYLGFLEWCGLRLYFIHLFLCLQSWGWGGILVPYWVTELWTCCFSAEQYSQIIKEKENVSLVSCQLCWRLWWSILSKHWQGLCKPK